MRDALNATGHPIVYSIDDWGVTNTWQYGTYVRPATYSKTLPSSDII